ncbi:hypothetical protein ACIRD3_13680 [Kitasatospora sp. NPDC093550]|uniref:hypothetical protein n=1 Tax=Kitasatospora sp. NPDC093550 TaxID=3364089 RepID=UPI0038020838
MPFPAEALRFDLSCGIGPDGRWRCWVGVKVAAEALRPLGLHPDQPSAAVDGPSPPRWWHAEAERRSYR